MTSVADFRKALSDADKAKLSYITVTQIVNLDTLESGLNQCETKLSHVTVTQPVDLDAMESTLAADHVKTALITVTNPVNLDTISGGSGVSPSDQAKLDNISVAQPVNLDTMESDIAAHAVKLNHIAVSQAVALDAMESDIAAHTAKLALLTVTSAVNVNTVEATANSAAAKTGFLTVTQPVDLDALEIGVLTLISDMVELQGYVTDETYPRAHNLGYKEFSAITAAPTAALASPNVVNIFPVNTAAGDVSLASLGTPATLGLAAGDRVIFRKSTTDANRVLYPTTLYGQSVTITLAAHYSATLAQIDLLVVNSTTYLLLNH